MAKHIPKNDGPSLFAPATPAAAPAAAKPPAEVVEVEPVDVKPIPKKAKKKAAGKKGKYATAESMAKAQQSISVSEFFVKNRHLLGFDNPRKALLTTVKEAVDNSLDACEEAGILPVITIKINQLAETHYLVSVQDNGPGIVKAQIPNIFGRLLYGSKFHRLRMSRGQQGIGISAAGMYGLLTTGQPVRIVSKIGKTRDAHHYVLKMDTKKNKPDIISDTVVDWDVDHGTRVEIELEAKYLRGRQSVDEYIRQTAVANPHVTFHYTTPDGRYEHYEAAVQELPPIPKEVKPHPHGIELGVLIKMIQDTPAKSLQQFFTTEFSRVTPNVVKEIVKIAGSGLTPQTRPTRIDGPLAKALYEAIEKTKILAPQTNCVVPIGEEELIRGLESVVNADFYTAVSRRPSVYRGNPFVIEAALAYGRKETPEQKKQRLEIEIDQDAPTNGKDSDTSSLASVLRLANRVPLLYQAGACAIHKSIVQTNWKSYGLVQARGALPSGEVTIVVHMGSVWVPFTSEAKEALASYPEIVKELKLALQECGRKLGQHIRKTVRLKQELKKRSYIEKYIPSIGEALRDILDLKDSEVDDICFNLKDVLEKSRKM